MYLMFNDNEDNEADFNNSGQAEIDKLINYSYSYNVLYKNTVIEYASLEIKEIDNETYKMMNNINCVKNRKNNKNLYLNFIYKFLYTLVG